MSDVIDHLRAVPLFSGMTEGALDSIAQLASEIRFGEGDSLMSEGDPGDAFFVIVDGRVRVHQGTNQIRELGPGDFLGEIALIDGRPRTASVSAASPVKALVVYREAFARLIDEHPPVRYGILTALTDRIRREASAPSD